MSDPLDYWRNPEPRCPHCGGYQRWEDFAHSIVYEDGGEAELTCHGCRKTFVCVTSTEYKFSTAVSEEAASDENWGPQEADAEAT